MKKAMATAAQSRPLPLSVSASGSPQFDFWPFGPGAMKLAPPHPLCILSRGGKNFGDRTVSNSIKSFDILKPNKNKNKNKTPNKNQN